MQETKAGVKSSLYRHQPLGWAQFAYLQLGLFFDCICRSVIYHAIWTKKHNTMAKHTSIAQLRKEQYSAIAMLYLLQCVRKVSISTQIDSLLGIIDSYTLTFYIEVAERCPKKSIKAMQSLLHRLDKISTTTIVHTPIIVTNWESYPEAILYERTHRSIVRQQEILLKRDKKAA